MSLPYAQHIKMRSTQNTQFFLFKIEYRSLLSHEIVMKSDESCRFEKGNFESLEDVLWLLTISQKYKSEHEGKLGVL